MAHLTIRNAVLNPGGMRSRIGLSKSLPKTREEPDMDFLGAKVKEMEYWSRVWGAREK